MIVSNGPPPAHVFHIVHTGEGGFLPALICGATRSLLAQSGLTSATQTLIVTDKHLSRAERVAKLAGLDSLLGKIYYLPETRVDGAIESLIDGNRLNWPTAIVNYAPRWSSLPITWYDSASFLCCTRAQSLIHLDSGQELPDTIETEESPAHFPHAAREELRHALGVHESESLLLPLCDSTSEMDVYPFVTTGCILGVAQRKVTLVLPRDAPNISRAIRHYREGYLHRLLLTSDPLLSLLPAADVAISQPGAGEPLSIALARMLGLPVVSYVSHEEMYPDGGGHPIALLDRLTKMYLPAHKSVASFAAATDRALSAPVDALPPCESRGLTSMGSTLMGLARACAKAVTDSITPT
jgi:hypothetical protein